MPAKEGKHTPGPWEFDTSGRYYAPNVVRHNGMVVCKMLDPDVTDYDMESNAALVTAAPDLLAALKAVTDHLADVMAGPMIAGAGIEFVMGVENIPTIAAARAAIAKAERA